MIPRGKTPVIAIVGPTASGKSALAVEIGRKIGGEIISADSRQVYRGLDLGAGKITKKEAKGVPHHLLDVADPRKQFSAARYKKLAEAAVRKIIQNGKVPILCGGTGFYIDTLLGAIAIPEVSPNARLRKKLATYSTDKLYALLKKRDPRRAASIDRHNPVRLIRAIEIAEALGRVPPQSKRISPYNILWIGLSLPFTKLEKKIEKRLKDRLEHGMLSEAKRLHRQRLSWKRMEALGLEYRYQALYLQGKISREEMEKRILTESTHYAKRQMRWWKRNKEIRWFDPKEKKRIFALIERFLKR